MPLGGVACYAACHAAEVAHTQTAHCLALQSHPDVLLATVLNSNSKNIQIKRGGRGGGSTVKRTGSSRVFSSTAPCTP